MTYRLSVRVALLPLLLAGLTLIACRSGGRAAQTAALTPAPQAATQGIAQTAPATPKLPVTVTDKDGRSVTVSDISRIIPLNGEITEIIYALGLGQHVVGVDISSTYPPEARRLPSIGYQRTLAAEGILALKPTLVIGNENAGPPSVLEQIRTAGVTVYIMKYSPTIESVPVKIREVAAALGVPERGEELARTAQAEIDAARALAARATTKPRVAFLNVRGAGTQQIWGKGTVANAMITAAGAIDAGAEAGITGSKPITAEALVTAQPDVILMLTASFESAGGLDGVLAIPGIAQTPAGRNRRVVHFEDQYLFGLGPRTGRALMDLIRALHPELQ